MGAAFGVLITSTVLLPFVGIGGTAAGLVVLKFVSLVCVGIGYGNSQPA